jgi:hypothetical protein
MNRYAQDTLTDAALQWTVRHWLRLLLFISAFCFLLSNLPAVTLAWNALSDPGVAGYNVYYGGASGTYTNELNAGSATNITINGLLHGATYYFAATAYYANDIESLFSDEVVYLVPPVPVLLSALPQYKVTSFYATNRLGQRVLASTWLLTNLVLSANFTGVWTLQASTNLFNWATYKTGTGAVTGIKVPVTNTLPRRFFRLRY